jgi:hypothetical protein
MEILRKQERRKSATWDKVVGFRMRFNNIHLVENGL